MAVGPSAGEVLEAYWARTQATEEVTHHASQCSANSGGTDTVHTEPPIPGRGCQTSGYLPLMNPEFIHQFGSRGRSIYGHPDIAYAAGEPAAGRERYRFLDGVDGTGIQTQAGTTQQGGSEPHMLELEDILDLEALVKDNIIEIERSAGDPLRDAPALGLRQEL